MPSPRMLWNALVPWRRRRRYYFLATVARLQDPELAIAPDKLPDIFNVTPAVFADFCSGQQIPRLFVQSLARLAYKVPPPSRRYVWTPMVVLSTAAIVIAVFLLR